MIGELQEELVGMESLAVVTDAKISYARSITEAYEQRADGVTMH